ncbi:uncharacterized protein A1O5_01603 [Cladophialophora psammophila CBS 110553]|uniref:Uncharacterized protein n=1 Tax=Cladophialophora psammophila CBS 110553 TaxID=1182543 RepID=W9X366_9EURO|nr:uncharacterized protein A1O5_01603 [Cladophialophora psammophila CBS 110553]EXJ74907.1 hypothetical protein A1O5_01603 [Cladophialophora psammophila CBS 110553]
MVLPFVAGKETNHRFEANLPLSNPAPFDKDLSDPKPDVYHGAAPSAIHPRVRADVDNYTIPLKANTCRPAAPNSFIEGKVRKDRRMRQRDKL